MFHLGNTHILVTWSKCVTEVKSHSLISTWKNAIITQKNGLPLKGVN